MRYVLASIILFFFVVIPTLAATNDFEIQVRIVDDPNPPTIPSALTIASTTDTTVELTWGASTDDQQLSGYQILRDNVGIATTTLTTYTDTGLTPETYYTYNVRAFDHVFNYSTSSNDATTTTLAAPVDPPDPDPDPGGGRGQTLALVALTVETLTNSAALSWETNRYAQFELRWGETDSYEMGFMLNQVYQREHETLITELEPNTTYYYQLIAYDRSGDRELLSEDSFTTQAAPDTTSPPNVSAFSGQYNDGNAVLSWQNPAEDFAYVRIVRNPYFYPTDPNNGYVVYQGEDERLIDRDAFAVGDVVYYTAFVYDAAGNRSSGAIVWVATPGAEVATAVDPKPESATSSATSTATSTEEGTVVPTLSLDDIVIIQNGEVIESVDGRFLVDTDQKFTISAPFEIFPRHLKTIQITLENPLDSSVTYSFLLRANNARTAYEATIDALGLSGTIPFTISVYDYSAQTSVSAKGSIIANNIEPLVQVVENIGSWYSQWWVLIVFFLVLLLWLLLMRRRGEAEDKHPVRFS